VDTVLASNERAQVNPLAKLLGVARDDEEDEAAPNGTATVASAATPMPAKPAVSVKVASTRSAIQKRTGPSSADAGADKLPSDSATPKHVQVAALLPPAPSSVTGEPADRTNAATPNDVIRARGYWQGPPDGMAVAPSARPPARDASTKPGSAKAATAAIGGPFGDLR